jgi:hypothetical protein
VSGSTEKNLNNVVARLKPVLRAIRIAALIVVLIFVVGIGVAPDTFSPIVQALFGAPTSSSPTHEPVQRTQRSRDVCV